MYTFFFVNGIEKIEKDGAEVKTWEMERSHKLDPNKHRSVDPKRFHISANGGMKFNNDQANKAETEAARCFWMLHFVSV